VIDLIMCCKNVVTLALTIQQVLLQTFMLWANVKRIIVVGLGKNAGNK